MTSHTTRSFRDALARPINDDYRVVGTMEGDDEVVWFWVGSHAEYEKLLKRL